MQNLNFTLKVINGAITLLTISLLIFMTFYIVNAFKRRRLSWRNLWFGLPISVSLAFIIYIDKLGALITRLVVWTWRNKGGDSSPFNTPETWWLFIGALVTGLGMLLMIRLLSRPRFGDWPWLASAAITTLYVVCSYLFEYG
jgi:hypothetical protein